MKNLRAQLLEITAEWFGKAFADYAKAKPDQMLSSLAKEIVRRGQDQGTVEYRAIRRAIMLTDFNKLTDDIPAVTDT